MTPGVPTGICGPKTRMATARRDGRRPCALSASPPPCSRWASSLPCGHWLRRIRAPRKRTILNRRGRAAKDAANAPYPLIQLEPESERLARLREQAEALTPAPVAPPPDETPPPDPVVIPTRVQPALVAPPRAPSSAPRRTAVQVPRQPPPAQSTPKAKVVAAGSVPKNERLATLDTMAGGFFTQSMTHATDAKKELLLGARNRSAAKRKACRSDACLADAYVRQIRETSAIMEGRTGPPK